MSQEQVQKQRQTSKTTNVQEMDEASPDIRDEKLTEDIDAILADIDEVLEENAEEFVRAYVQKGGE